MAAGFREGFDEPDYPEREDPLLFLEHWKHVLLDSADDENLGGSIVSIRWWYEGSISKSFPVKKNPF